MADPFVRTEIPPGTDASLTGDHIVSGMQRTRLSDSTGALITEENPLPVQLEIGDVTIGSVTITDGAGNARDANVDSNNQLNVNPGALSSATDSVSVPSSAATVTLSNVASSASSVPLLAANSSREGATIYNDSTQTLYVKLGAAASTSSYTVQLVAGAYWEMPIFNNRPYRGAIDGIWASANGNARISEFT